MYPDKHLYGMQPPKANTLTKQKQEVRTPRIDLFELEGQYYIRLSLPGVKKENLKIFLNEKGLLEINGKVLTHIPNQTKNVVLQEIFQGPFQRTIKIPGKFDKNSVQFNYTSGILEIFLNKL